MRHVHAGVLLAAVLLSGGAARGQSLPGTLPWDRPADPAASMVADLHLFLDAETLASVARRPRHWNRDLSSDAAYLASVAPNRARLEHILGATGKRVSPVTLDAIVPDAAIATVPSDDPFRVPVIVVRWSVYPGFEAEGLLLNPAGEPKACVVLLGDADARPEVPAGLAPGTHASGAPISARSLCDAGCRVLIPTLVSRASTFSGNPAVRMTNLSHREWVYRMAFEAGRHILGYEIDEVRAAVDWLSAKHPGLPIGVAGHGEGGLVALGASALDPRIAATWVAGSFGPREGSWAEPIDRNVWGLLDEFGDAEIASLIYPRKLVIEASRGPETTGPNPPVNGLNDAASGRLTSPARSAVDREAARIAGLIPAHTTEFPVVLGDETSTWSSQGFSAFLLALTGQTLESSNSFQYPPRQLTDPDARMQRIVNQMVSYTQGLIRTSELRRDAYWNQANRSSPEAWSASTKPFRATFHEELIGRFPPPSEPISARTKQLADRPNWTAHAVEIPVWPGVSASGVLLLPKDLKPGERRPVVVCQHGLEGTPDPIVDPSIKSVYNSYGAQLADRGYIVYAPQNPYTGHDTFRTLQRKAQPLKKTLFSIIAAQHQQTLNWLKTQPNVDPGRIAFYGLSYGGKTAMRVPAMLEDYCLSICSADFNEWAVKTTNIDRAYSYMYTLEYDMYEFALAERFNYAEMAALIAPRPFMVERGHQDGVAPDEWIGYEYAKVKRLYDTLGLSDRTEVGYFNAGHQIDGKATFAFLARHLNWPRGMP
ncbi:dienelactone hydrolase family protein [Isosphaeraceae bacterium EP7]